VTKGHASLLLATNSHVSVREVSNIRSDSGTTEGRALKAQREADNVFAGIRRSGGISTVAPSPEERNRVGRKQITRTVMTGEFKTKRLRYALAGAALGLGAPAGLLLVRMRRQRLSVRSIVEEIESDLETYVYATASTASVFAAFGGVLGYLADNLVHLATTDPLTGLFNARVFYERLRQELSRAARYRDPLSVLVLDLDGLKRINDQYGHQAGDTALRKVAAAIRTGLREIDLGSRLGGDEFGVITPHTTENAATGLAERLRARLVTTLTGRRHDASVSIGIASLVPSTDASPTPRSVMSAADEALYRAKRDGGNRVAHGRL
jgi:diguanylate cyclase (GGDEF)-like protein